MTSQVFAYLPDKAVESSRLMHQRIHHYVEKYWTQN
jgi:hypothetical protein